MPLNIMLFVSCSFFAGTVMLFKQWFWLTHVYFVIGVLTFMTYVLSPEARYVTSADDRFALGLICGIIVGLAFVVSQRRKR